MHNNNTKIPVKDESSALVNTRQNTATAETIPTEYMKEPQARSAKRKLLCSQELNKNPKHQLPCSTPIKSFVVESLEFSRVLRSAGSSNASVNRFPEIQNSKESIVDISEGNLDDTIGPINDDTSDIDFMDEITDFGKDDSFADPEYKVPEKKAAMKLALADLQVTPQANTKHAKNHRKVVIREDINPAEVIFQKGQLGEFAIEYYLKPVRKMQRMVRKAAKCTREVAI